MSDTSPDSLNIIEVLGSNCYIVELANEPGTHWHVRVVRQHPALAVWKRTEWTSGKKAQDADD